MPYILFDANLPPALAKGIQALTEGRGIGAVSIAELYKTTKISDERWIGELERHDIVGVISQDYFDKTPQEIAAYHKAKIPFFYLAKAYNNFALFKKCSLLLIKWEIICQQTLSVKGHAEFEIPADRGLKIRQLRRKKS